jgi:hypothetical protein
MRAFLSFFESDLNSSTAALTTSGRGSSDGTIIPEADGTIIAEEGTTAEDEEGTMTMA